MLKKVRFIECLLYIKIFLILLFNLNKKLLYIKNYKKILNINFILK